MSEHTLVTCRFGRARRDESGLATLEWLIIVGAVAALAVLAVVLVYGFVEETGDRLEAPIPRLTAAHVQAAGVVNEAKSAEAEDFATWDDWEQHFSDKCARIEFTIFDERIAVTGNEFTRALGGTRFDSAAASAASVADPDAATATKAQALCVVEQLA